MGEASVGIGQEMKQGQVGGEVGEGGILGGMNEPWPR